MFYQFIDFYRKLWFYNYNKDKKSISNYSNNIYKTRNY